jgi:hypothetical protein
LAICGRPIIAGVVLKFEVPNRGCHADARNFKFTALGEERVAKAHAA